MKKISGSFIESFLNNEDISIIQNDSTLLIEKLKTGEYTALRVAQAFCKTAAIAHQIVSIISYYVVLTSVVCLLGSYSFSSVHLPAIANRSSCRTTASTRSFSSRRFSEQRS